MKYCEELNLKKCLYSCPFLFFYAPPVFLDVRYNYSTTDVVVKFQITIMNCFFSREYLLFCSMVLKRNEQLCSSSGAVEGNKSASNVFISQ